jgi:hypothetical protein
MRYLIQESRELVQVEVFNDGNNWAMNWKGGGSFVFRGSQSAFALFLRRLKASDDKVPPRSHRSEPYKMIAQEIAMGSDRIIWVWKHNLKNIKEIASSPYKERYIIRRYRKPLFEGAKYSYYENEMDEDTFNKLVKINQKYARVVIELYLHTRNLWTEMSFRPFEQWEEEILFGRENDTVKERFKTYQIAQQKKVFSRYQEVGHLQNLLQYVRKNKSYTFLHFREDMIIVQDLLDSEEKKVEI